MIILCTLPISSFAYEYGEIDIDSMIVEKTNGKEKIRSINASNMNRIRVSKSKKYKNKNETERLEEIITALGIDMDSKAKKEMLSKMDIDTIGEMQSKQVYLELDENGNSKKITEAEALEKSTLNVSYQADGPIPEFKMHDPETNTSVNGYMELTTLVSYTPNIGGKGATPNRYVLIGMCKWLRLPMVRKNDCIAFVSRDFDWENLGNGMHSLCISYNAKRYDYLGEQLITEFFDEIPENEGEIRNGIGVLFNFDMPPLVRFTGNVEDISCVLMAVGYVKGTSIATEDISADLVYVHSQKELFKKYKFTFSPEGGIIPTISLGIEDVAKSYVNPYRWLYSSDYNMFF